jgi:uncharacterized protein YhbP (UPF0306 family)
MQQHVERARNSIGSNMFMTLATTDGASVWIAQVGYVVDTDYNFYWYSATDARHSEHIQQNPHIAVGIFNPNEPLESISGLQIAGTAVVVPEADLSHVMEMFFRLLFPDERVRAQRMLPIEAFSGNAMRRFYRFTPTEVYIYMPGRSDKQRGRRMLVNLEELRSQPSHP